MEEALGGNVLVLRENGPADDDMHMTTRCRTTSMRNAVKELLPIFSVPEHVFQLVRQWCGRDDWLIAHGSGNVGRDEFTIDQLYEGMHPSTLVADTQSVNHESRYHDIQ